MEVKWQHTYMGVLWGILMSSQDLTTYYLYFLLLFVSPEIVNCNNFLSYYVLFSFVNTISSGIFYPISGWITDMTANRSAVVFKICNVLQLVLICAQFLPIKINLFGEYQWILLLVIWQLTQLISIQNSNSLWKLIKQTVYETDKKLVINEDHLLMDTNEKIKDNLSLINHIGNTGDLTSDITETFLLSILMILIESHKFDFADYKFAFIYILAAVMMMNTILCFGSIKLLDVKEPTLVLNNHINKISYRNPITWIYESIKNFYKQKIAFHAFWHCVILGIYVTIVQYPLSLMEVMTTLRSTIVITVKPLLAANNVSPPLINNYCGGTVLNLLLLGTINNTCYLLGSIFYNIFIVKSSPTKFYKKFYPAFSVILLAITITLLFDIYYIVTMVLVGFITIIPYYLTYYDYYLFTEQTDGQSYGFVLGSYGAVTTVLTALVQSLYLANIPFSVIIGSGVLLLLISLIYSYFIAYLVGKKDISWINENYIYQSI
jgi:hypothetical protein